MLIQAARITLAMMAVTMVAGNPCPSGVTFLKAPMRRGEFMGQCQGIKSPDGKNELLLLPDGSRVINKRGRRMRQFPLSGPDVQGPLQYGISPEGIVAVTASNIPVFTQDLRDLQRADTLSIDDRGVLRFSKSENSDYFEIRMLDEFGDDACRDGVSFKEGGHSHPV